MTHLACTVTHHYLPSADSSSLYGDSFLVSVLSVVAVPFLYKNPNNSSSTLLRLVFIYLLVNTIVLPSKPCVILLSLSFTLITLNLGRSP